jgi:hypothetical protein
MPGSCWVVAQLAASQEGLSSMELVISTMYACIWSWVEFPSLQVYTERVSISVELVSHIQQGLLSNLDWSTAYLERISPWISSVSQGNCWDSTAIRRRSVLPRESESHYDWQSVCLSWCRAPSGLMARSSSQIILIHQLQFHSRLCSSQWECR